MTLVNHGDDPVANLAGVSLRYGKTVALDAIDLAVPAGCMVGLIGPDGVGKSSLLALIAGARKVQEGVVVVLGGDMRAVRHRNLVCPSIAYMPQGLGKNLYPALSVEDNLQFFWSPVRPRCRRAPAAYRRSDQGDRSLSFSRTPGRQALGRHEAETRAVLRPDP